MCQSLPVWAPREAQATLTAKKLPKGTLVAVDWADAWSSEYDDGSEIPLALRRVGYVASHTDAGIKLIGEISTVKETDFSRKIQFIPTCNITGIKKLK